MTFEEKAALVRCLKGAASSILWILLLSEESLTAVELQEATGYSDKPVSQALARLRALGLVAHHGRSRGWRVSGSNWGEVMGSRKQKTKNKKQKTKRPKGTKDRKQKTKNRKQKTKRPKGSKDRKQKTKNRKQKTKRPKGTKDGKRRAGGRFGRGDGRKLRFIRGN